MVNTFCKKLYSKAEDTYYNVTFFIYSPDKASIDNLLPDLAYFNLRQGITPLVSVGYLDQWVFFH